MQPSQVLFQGEALPRALPVCDHYAGTEVRMRKALSLQAELGPVFDITFDCEDGAPVGKEAEHAQLVVDILLSPENQFNRVGVRIHDPSHSCWKSDVATLVGKAGQKIAFVMIPKVESAKQTQTVIDEINRVTKAAGIDREIPVQALIETHGALHDVYAIAALPQIESLSFGLMDFVSAHHGAIPGDAMDRGQFDHPLIARAMLEISAACHAHGKVASHNVCTNINDVSIIESDTLRAKNEFAYTRKWSIHPNQIPVIVKALSPTATDVEIAAAILLAAQEANWGPIQHAGKLHDRASYRYFWTVLQKAHLSGQTIPPAALKLL
ncbi:HpcH/HpaI aldolase/citrate lyase family protein [Polynucleobacter victoriensis]|uniref:Citrate lyase subunit beta / citryl-CoA lyase n=1 Tax=Polynucleobacter victoriensis TaxID=2049319 RepID=A0A212U155_9BURK|nr:aldolase/citrate lyase family protein [Polynucleobacter victoriensis]SNC71861.1 citrate lyase subunit beta / citryl-CoA lyase [Polynucleobacter victoriensis]